MAGEGSVRERGRSPISKSLPLSNRVTFYFILSCEFERGNKGVSIDDEIK